MVTERDDDSVRRSDDQELFPSLALLPTYEHNANAQYMRRLSNDSQVAGSVKNIAAIGATTSTERHRDDEFGLDGAKSELESKAYFRPSSAVSVKNSSSPHSLSHDLKMISCDEQSRTLDRNIKSDSSSDYNGSPALQSNKIKVSPDLQRIPKVVLNISSANTSAALLPIGTKNVDNLSKTRCSVPEGREGTK